MRLKVVINGGFMKKASLILILVITAFMTGCKIWGIRGNGNVKEETREVTEFDAIEASGAYTIDISVGDKPSLEISAEENLLKYIKTSVHGGKLVIDNKKSISPRKEIYIRITTPSLNSVESSGANNLSAYNINSDNFKVDLSGAGHIRLEGEAGRVRIDLSGAGGLNAKKLRAKDVRIEVSGASSADVYASEFLDASVSGVGSIDFYGDPKKVNTSVSGVGSINRK